MCGIAGILRIHEPGAPPPSHVDSVPDAWLDVLDDSIRHRGPDGAGRFRDRATRPDGTVVDVALVHRRLSIIDHAGGAQPMVLARGPDGTPGLVQPPSQRAQCVSDGAIPTPGSIPAETPRSRSGLFLERDCNGERITTIDATRIHDPDLVAVVFNGCIYNHRDLRAELEAAGHRFHTDHADTEVLLHGWRAWGESLWGRCRAMLAAALWDRASATLTLARDRFGEKPLYSFDLPDGLAFSSSPADLIRLGVAAGFEIRIDPGALSEWIAMGFSLGPTPIEGLREFLPGSWVCSDGRGETSRPSDLDLRSEAGNTLGTTLPSDPSPDADEHAVMEAIETAVARRLDADVPVACFLSGGVDSSLVALAASRIAGASTTLCVRLDSADFDESRHAALAARAIGSDHYEVTASADPARDLTALIEGLGLPFGDSSLLPTHWVSRAAHEIAGVAIGGDGGDELFMGYQRQQAAGVLVPLAYIWLDSSFMSPAVFPRRDPRSISDKAARLLVAASKLSYRSLIAIHQHPELKQLLGRSARLVRWKDRLNGARPAQCDDLDFYLPGDLMRKVDTASMACPIEVRSPLLDDDLTRLCLTLSPARLRGKHTGSELSHGERKGLLRAVARRHLPREIVDRPKQGFAIPIGEWFRSDFGGLRQLLHDHLGSADPFPGLAEAGIEINMSFVRKMLAQHDAAGEPSRNPWHGRDHSQRLYMLLVLSIWCRWLAGVRKGDHRADRSA